MSSQGRKWPADGRDGRSDVITLPTTRPDWWRFVVFREERAGAPSSYCCPVFVWRKLPALPLFFLSIINDTHLISFFFLLIPSNLMQFQTFLFFFFFSPFFMAAAARVIKSTGYQLFWFHVDSSPSLFRLSIGLLSTTAAMRWWALTSNLVLRPFLLLRLIFFLRISWFSSRDRWKQCRIWLCYSFILLERRKREAILLFSEFVVLSAALFFFSILL